MRRMGIVVIIGWLIWAVAVISMVTGCTAMTRTGEDIAQTVRGVNDAKFSGTQELYCNGQSTGAVARALGNDKDMWELYWTICNRYRGGLSDVDVPPVPGVQDGL